MITVIVRILMYSALVWVFKSDGAPEWVAIMGSLIITLLAVPGRTRR